MQCLSSVRGPACNSTCQTCFLFARLSTALAAIVPRSGLFVLLQMDPWPAAQHATRVAILVEYCKHFTNDVARNGSVWKKWFYRSEFIAVKIKAITLPAAMALSAASREHATEPPSRPTTATQSFWVVEFVWSMVNRFLPSCAKLIGLRMTLVSLHGEDRSRVTAVSVISCRFSFIPLNITIMLRSADVPNVFHNAGESMWSIPSDVSNWKPRRVPLDSVPSHA